MIFNVIIDSVNAVKTVLIKGKNTLLSLYLHINVLSTHYLDCTFVDIKSI